jgi:hypothetical protein
MVAGLTAAALATIGFFAYQASATRPESFGRPRPSAVPAEPAVPGPTSAPPGNGAVANPFPLPRGSGQGVRVVYALGDDRVWLAASGDRVRTTFKVVPGEVDPAPGEYTVTSRSGRVTGSDGVPVKHVVRFARSGRVVIGFSVATGPTPDRPRGTVPAGGIRESAPDGAAMWRFATVGVKVVVIR